MRLEPMSNIEVPPHKMAMIAFLDEVCGKICENDPLIINIIEVHMRNLQRIIKSNNLFDKSPTIVANILAENNGTPESESLHSSIATLLGDHILQHALTELHELLEDRTVFLRDKYKNLEERMLALSKDVSRLCVLIESLCENDGK